MFSRFQKLLDDSRALLDEKGWPPDMGPSRLHKFVHFWIHVWRSFDRNRCLIRASALSYVTLLSLIPLMAVAISITSSLLKKEGEEQIQQFVEKFVASVMPPAMLNTNDYMPFMDEFDIEFGEDDPMAPAGGTNVTEIQRSGAPTNSAVLPSYLQGDDALQARKTVARNIHKFIQNTQSGTLGVTGMVLLIFTAISLLSRIEVTFNDIWGVARGRSWFMRIVLYWCVISLAPILVVTAIGLASGPHLESTRELMSVMPFFSNLLFQFLPVVLLCLTFAAFYSLMPNTKVEWKAALVGGVVGGVLFH